MSQRGTRGAGEGYILNQAQQLQFIIDALEVYNNLPSPDVDRLCQDIYKDESRIPQAPLVWRQHSEADRGTPQQGLFRTLTTPLKDWDLSQAWTLTGLRDALPSDIEATMDMSMAGHQTLIKSLMIQAALTKRTAGAIGTAYRASFYNGETDVPRYGENAFASAHSHYAGLNTTTLAESHVWGMIEDVTEHGHGTEPGSLELWYGTAQESDVIAVFDRATYAPNEGQQQVTKYGARGSMSLQQYGVKLRMSPLMPAGYLWMVATDCQPLLRRRHPDPDWHGMQILGGNKYVDKPLVGAFFMDAVNFGVGLLGAGCCRQLVASTTYTNPTFNEGQTT